VPGPHQKIGCVAGEANRILGHESVELPLVTRSSDEVAAKLAAELRRAPDQAAARIAVYRFARVRRGSDGRHIVALPTGEVCRSSVLSTALDRAIAAALRSAPAVAEANA
jgi:hypothetical protein